MKFKKVEISAFRIYDNPKDSTFDFTTPDGRVANFISLWAPNGFGKTSFYDAVEWGVTNNVQRFYQSRNTDESIDALQNINSKQVNLLKNNKSELKTSVKITYDNLQLSERNLKVNKNRKSDIYRDGEQIENKEFRRVILSQEWISAFLKEVDGEKRYQKFIENPELFDTDLYYKGVKNLVSYCYENISKLREKISEEQTKITKIEDDNLLETLNSTINSLILLGEDLNILPNNTSDKEAIAFRNNISSRIITFNRNVVIKDLLNFISLAKTGDDNIVGLNYYYESLILKTNSEFEIEQANSLLQKFHLRQNLQTEIKNYNSQKEIAINLRKSTDEILEVFGEYLKIANNIEAVSENKVNVDKDYNINNIKLQSTQQKEVELKTTCDSLAIRITAIQNEVDELSNLYIQKAKVEDDAKKLSEKLFIANDTLEKQNETISNHSKFISELKHLMSLFINNDFYRITDLIPDKILELYNDLSIQGDIQRNVNLEISDLNTKIKQQENLNSTIEKFVGMGLEIVNDSKSSNCPLCNNSYKSYIELANNIANNKVLSQQLQDLHKEKNIKNTQLASVVKKINELIEKIVGVLELEIKSEVDRLTLLTLDYNNSIKKNDLLKQEYSGILEKVNLYTINVKGLTFEDHKALLENSILKLQNQYFQQSELLTKLTSEKNNLLNQVTTLENKSNLFKEELLKLQSIEVFKKVFEWFETNHPNQTIDFAFLRETNLSHMVGVDNLINKLTAAQTNFKLIDEELTTHSKENIASQINDLISRKEQADKIINIYENFLMTKLDFFNFPISKIELLRLLDEKETSFNLEFEKNQEIQNKYTELAKFTKDLIPYLQSEKVKEEIRNAQTEVEFLEKNVLPSLLDEKSSAKEFLNDKIQGYFYTDLINDIYNKIDPHPDFKSVEFRPNFDYDSPRLDIFVVNTSNEEKLIPNLYFSTAQTNILSLSIFLASALTSKEYDCIFIDDPIQSMDSINVLSTIDLLRSIVVNQNKQIILSTHDQNFHNLLKKKIPTEIFDSKFLELESFGKVRPSK